MKRLRQIHTRKASVGNAPRYRRSPYLISYWVGPIAVIENYLTGEKVAAEGLVADLLSYSEKPRTVAEVCAEFPDTKAAVVQGVLRSLARCGLVEAVPPRGEKAGQRFNGWKAWSPSASYFHFSTKNVKYARGEVEDFGRLRKLAAEIPLPTRKKTGSGVKTVVLSRARGGGEFVRVLEERRTWREFSAEPLELTQLEELLRLSFGVQGWARIPGVGRLPLKTSPSGGALHPLEAYIAIRKVRGIERGIYRYDDERHRLEWVSRELGKKELRRMLAGQDWFCDAAVIVFLTAVFPRTQWKYEHPRAYRVVLAEAGHVCQTFCLTATWLGLAPFCTMAFADSEIEKVLRVDGVEESLVYVMGAGARPGRAATADRLRLGGNSKHE